MNATILFVANRKEENSAQEKEQIKLKKEKSPVHEGREDMDLEEEKKDKERTGMANEDLKLKHKEKDEDDEENVEEEEGETTMYRLAELEFYYWGGAHKDVFTHKEEMQQHSGKWYPPSLSLHTLTHCVHTVRLLTYINIYIYINHDWPGISIETFRTGVSIEQATSKVWI